MTAPVSREALDLIDPDQCPCGGNDKEPGKDLCFECLPPADPTECRYCDAPLPCDRRSCVAAERYDMECP